MKHKKNYKTLASSLLKNSHAVWKPFRTEINCYIASILSSSYVNDYKIWDRFMAVTSSGQNEWTKKKKEMKKKP